MRPAFVLLFGLAFHNDRAFAANDPPIRGAFVQIDNGSNGKWTAEQWAGQLKRMKAVGIDLVVVQYTQFVNATGEASDVFPAGNWGNDPLKFIFAAAKRHGLEVMVGLRNDIRLQGSELLDNSAELARHLKADLAASLKIVNKVADDYFQKDNETIAGWYIPIETFNYVEPEVVPAGATRWPEQLNRHFAAIAAECKKRADKPVAFSAAINFTLASPEKMADQITRTVTGTGVTVVMLQDSVAVRNVPQDKVAEKVGPYADAVGTACGKLGRGLTAVEPWLVVEVHDAAGTLDRLKRQVAVGNEKARKVVAFQFPGRFSDDLYDGYKSWVEEGKRK